MQGRSRARGQGLTEYIIIVGLVGILLVMAVRTFGRQIDVTIQGSRNSLGNNVTNNIPAGPGGNIGGNGGGIRRP